MQRKNYQAIYLDTFILNPVILSKPVKLFESIVNFFHLNSDHIPKTSQIIRFNFELLVFSLSLTNKKYIGKYKHHNITQVRVATYDAVLAKLIELIQFFAFQQVSFSNSGSNLSGHFFGDDITTVKCPLVPLNLHLQMGRALVKLTEKPVSVMVRIKSGVRSDNT